jgi:hypothetical protein
MTYTYWKDVPDGTIIVSNNGLFKINIGTFENELISKENLLLIAYRNDKFIKVNSTLQYIPDCIADEDFSVDINLEDPINFNIWSIRSIPKIWKDVSSGSLIRLKRDLYKSSDFAGLFVIDDEFLSFEEIELRIVNSNHITEGAVFSVLQPVETSNAILSTIGWNITYNVNDKIDDSLWELVE